MLLEQDFAMILLDVRMPGLDGFETAQLIKERTRTRDIPIVFLTAARDEVSQIARGYGVGAVDYVLKPFDPDLLRSKVSVFAELEASRRALKRSEALLSGAFEAAPIGKTVLDAEGRIVRSNPAFARLVGRDAGRAERGRGHRAYASSRTGRRCRRRSSRSRAPTRGTGAERAEPRPAPAVERRRRGVGREVASAIESTEFAEPLLLAQWVDLTVRRRAEQDRADLLLEQAARMQAESVAERLSKLQDLTTALDALDLDGLLPELATRLAELFGVEAAEVQISGEHDQPRVVRAAGGHIRTVPRDAAGTEDDRWREVPLVIERTTSAACAWPSRRDGRLAPPSARCSRTPPTAPRWRSAGRSCTRRSIGSRSSSSAGWSPSASQR